MTKKITRAKRALQSAQRLVEEEESNTRLCPLLGGKPCLGAKCEWMGDTCCSVVSIDSSMSCIHDLLHMLAEAGAEGMCDHEEGASGLYN